MAPQLLEPSSALGCILSCAPQQRSVFPRLPCRLNPHSVLHGRALLAVTTVCKRRLGYTQTLFLSQRSCVCVPQPTLSHSLKRSSSVGGDVTRLVS